MSANKDHIYIIGVGAIGMALGALLKAAGKKVTLIRGSVGKGPGKLEEICVQMSSGISHRALLEITTMDNLQQIDGIIVIAIKSFGNEKLACTLKDKSGRSPIVLLQNGLGVERPFMAGPFPEIYRAVLFVTCQTIGPYHVRFKPVSICPVGIERGNRNKLHTLVHQLSTSNFAFKSELQIGPIIWKKTIINCVFNSVCPLLEVDNGIFHRDIEALSIARNIISECVAIADTEGIVLHSDEVESTLLQISRLSEGQYISTLQDIRNNRRTEMETLNLEVARMARQLDKTEQVRQTQLLGQLIRLKSGYGMSGPDTT